MFFAIKYRLLLFHKQLTKFTVKMMSKKRHLNILLEISSKEDKFFKL